VNVLDILLQCPHPSRWFVLSSHRRNSFPLTPHTYRKRSVSPRSLALEGFFFPFLTFSVVAGKLPVVFGRPGSLLSGFAPRLSLFSVHFLVYNISGPTGSSSFFCCRAATRAWFLERAVVLIFSNRRLYIIRYLLSFRRSTWLVTEFGNAQLLESEKEKELFEIREEWRSSMEIPTKGRAAFSTPPLAAVPRLSPGTLALERLERRRRRLAAMDGLVQVRLECLSSPYLFCSPAVKAMPRQFGQD